MYWERMDSAKRKRLRYRNVMMPGEEVLSSG